MYSATNIEGFVTAFNRFADHLLEIDGLGTAAQHQNNQPNLESEASFEVNFIEFLRCNLRPLQAVASAGDMDIMRLNLANMRKYTVPNSELYRELYIFEEDLGSCVKLHYIRHNPA